MVRQWRSVWLAWGSLLAIDLVSRASFLAPRLITLRGFINYAAAGIALWIFVRLLAAIRSRRIRIAVYAITIAIPMGAQLALFRSLGELATPTDFVALFDSPKIVLQGAFAGDRIGVAPALVLSLALASAWLLPVNAQPLVPRWRAAVASVVFASTILVGAWWWWASPVLQHPQPAFSCAVVGLLRRASVDRVRGDARITVPSPPPTKEPLPNIVLVLGESLAASHLGLYGYEERDTTPQLRAISDASELIALRDAVVSGPHTRSSVPYIFTGIAGPDPDGRVYRAPTLMQYAKARGYHTAFVSAQEEAWGGLDTLLREGADSFRTGLLFTPKIDVLKGSDDLVVLTHPQGVLATIESLREPFFLVVHMDGSHVPYGYHSPPSHKVFSEEEGINSMAAYDNTVRVTDEFVARTFHALRARDPNAWMFFTSDHGQALGEGGAFYNRGYQTNVVRDPLLVFPPPRVDRTRWLELVDAPTSACDLTPTLLHLMHTAPAPNAPMDCVDWLGDHAPKERVRVVTAYTPTYVGEPTMLVLTPDGDRAVYDLWRGTVTTKSGAQLSIAEHALPSEVAARLVRH